jgi:hypothetical protein
MIRFRDLKDFKNYRRVVNSMTKSFLKEDNISIPKGLTVDHIFPVSLGFDIGIPPEIVSDPRNIQFINRGDNSKKNNKCDSIPLYIQQWIIGFSTEYRKMNRKENQIIGIRNAQQKGIYIGRKPGTYESKEKFISKPKNKEAIELLRNGVKGCVVSEKLELNPNTVSKVKKIAKEMNLI